MLVQNPVKRKIFWILFFGVFFQCLPNLYAKENVADSLKRLLETSQDAKLQMEVNVHLADWYADSLKLASDYWEGALAASIRADDEYVKKIALNFLVRRYAVRDDKKVEQLLKLARKILPEKHNALFLAYLRVAVIWRKIRNNNSLEIVTGALERLKGKEEGQMTAEERIEWEFLTGLSIDYSSLVTNAYDNIEQAIPYIERALEMLKTYPLEERIHFEELCHFELSDLYMTVNDKRAVSEIKKMAELHKEGIQMNLTFQRLFYDDSNYKMEVYARMIFLLGLISKEEATEYYKEFIRLAKKKNCLSRTYDTSSRYYQYMGDYKKAIAYIDSVLYYHLFDSVILASIYTAQAKLYEKTGDYRKAYQINRKGDSVRMKVRSREIQQKLAEMQTRFDVNKLQLDKVRLKSRNNQIALIGMLILLAGILGWSIYQRLMVRKLRNMHESIRKANAEIIRQSEKAKESEKMKTAFLNSMCHEVRTPLNAISGFSTLMLDDSLTKEEKAEFQDLIQNNTLELTSLLDNMLELSRLISSEEPLPVELCDIHTLCKEKMELLKQKPDTKNIVCDLEAREAECIIRTNRFYLSCVIDNLLNNAVKFTEEGKICLAYQLVQEKGQFVVSVSDTGIGIAPDKREWVFERFTKVDNFKPGTGLGLYMCRIIISRLGGTIKVDADYMPGCRIVICLPL